MEENKPSTNHSEKAIYDLVLVTAALEKGDQRAYAELLDRYRESIYYMMLKMLSNEHDAEDLTIEAFGRAFKSLKNYNSTFAFSTWLYKIASNNCIDFMRNKKLNTTSIDVTFETDDGGEMTFDIRSEGRNPEEDYVKKQKDKLMRDIVDKLKPHYKRLIELYYFEELSIDEISKVLEVPQTTIKSQLFRSREMLANILKSSEGKY